MCSILLWVGIHPKHEMWFWFLPIVMSWQEYMVPYLMWVVWFSFNWLLPTLWGKYVCITCPFYGILVGIPTIFIAHKLICWNPIHQNLCLVMYHHKTWNWYICDSTGTIIVSKFRNSPHSLYQLFCISIFSIIKFKL